MHQGNEDLNRLLNRFTCSKVQIRKDRKREALNSWQRLVSQIVNYVQQEDPRFTMRVFPSGSYYERVKVKEPDEFDIMLEMENLELDAPPYGESEDDGLSDPPTGFTTVMIDQGEERQWQRDRCADRRGMLDGMQVKSVFSTMVHDFLRQQALGRSTSARCEGPAVTLKITYNRREYSVDLTLAIKDSTWPEDANEWRTRCRNGWPSQKLVNQICQQGCHLVAKKPKNFRGPNDEIRFFWRLSFSAAEKKLFLEGASGEATSCRNQVLRILKTLREELHMQPLKSYHLKTILLYECEANPSPSQWQSSCLGARFMGALKRLHHCLSQRSCPHYFIANLNLFEEFNPQKCQELQGRVHDIMNRPDRYIVP